MYDNLYLYLKLFHRKIAVGEDAAVSIEILLNVKRCILTGIYAPGSPGTSTQLRYSPRSEVGTGELTGVIY